MEFWLSIDTLSIAQLCSMSFQGGSSDELYQSVHSQASQLNDAYHTILWGNAWILTNWELSIPHQIFTLPKDTLLYPAHDYKGFTVSGIVPTQHLKFCQPSCHSFDLYYLQVTTVEEEAAYNARLTKDKVMLIKLKLFTWAEKPFLVFFLTMFYLLCFQETFKTIMESKYLSFYA
jgi:hypothetical protein